MESQNLEQNAAKGEEQCHEKEPNVKDVSGLHFFVNSRDFFFNVLPRIFKLQLRSVPSVFSFFVPDFLLKQLLMNKTTEKGNTFFVVCEQVPLIQIAHARHYILLVLDSRLSFFKIRFEFVCLSVGKPMWNTVRLYVRLRFEGFTE